MFSESQAFGMGYMWRAEGNEIIDYIFILLCGFQDKNFGIVIFLA